MTWLYRQLLVAALVVGTLLSGAVSAADPAPVVTGAMPGTASNVSGDSVTITGSGFTPESTVDFGFFQSLSVTYIDSSTIQAIVPVSDEAGAVDVTVRNADGQSATLVRGITLTRSAPYVSSITPSLGPVTGGTAVTLAGSGFYGGIRFSSVESSPAGTHACGIAAAKVYCWGSNNRGQIGDGTLVSRMTPVPVDTTGVLRDKYIVAVAAGLEHTLALSSDGKLFAWGYNNQGQLGNGTIVDALTPVEVNMSGVLAAKTIKKIAAGSYFSLVLASDGSLFSWGQNANGQLGNGSIVRSDVPVGVTMTGALAGKTVTDITASDASSHALDSDGKAYGWGYNQYGRVGDGTTSQRTAPTAVATTGALSGKQLVAIDAGMQHVVALDSEGKAYGWGYGTSGQLGQGVLSTSSSPVAAITSGALSGKVLTKINAGSSGTVAIDSDGVFYGWGQNNFGQLADTSTGNNPSPRVVATVDPVDGRSVTSFALGSSSGYVTTSSGRSYSWGYNVQGQLGVGDTTLRRQLTEIIDQVPRELKVAVDGVEAVLTSRLQESLAFQVPAHAAGFADVSVLEDGVPVASLTDAYEYISPPTTAGVSPSSASNSGGDLLTISGAGFASGARVQIGLRTISAVTYVNSTTLEVIVPVSDQLGAVDVTVINSDGQKSTLKNGFSYTGAQPTATNFSPTAGPAKGGQSVTINGTGFIQNLAFTKVTAAGNHSCGISNGTAYCWGDNTSGQLGDGTKLSRTYPAAIDTPGALAGKTLASIDTGTTHTVVADTDGRVYAWGDNSYGQLGDGTLIQRLTPVEVDMSGVLQGKTIVDVSAGTNHTAVVDSEGRVYSWGSNSHGQLGNNTITNSSVPVAVYIAGELSGKVIRSVTLGQAFSMALDSEGRVYGWGSNGQGQLGINSAVSPRVPTAMYVDGAVGGRGIQAIATGESTTALVLDVEGQVYGMGYNAFGQVGNNSTTAPQVPAAVYSTGVFAGKRIVSIAVGEYHSIALDSEGKLYSWGSNNSGQYGDGTLASVRYPVAAATSGSVVGKEIVGVIGGKYHSLFLDSGGKIHGAGANSAGQLGLAGAVSTTSTPRAAIAQAATTLRVLFDGAAGIIANQDESSVTVITPQHPAGVVDVAVVPRGTDPITLGEAYTYLEPPRITDITPSSGAVSGGDLVTIVGADFTPSTYVMIDDTRVDPIYINSSTLTFTTPAALTPGKVNVRVVNVDGQSATAPLAYEYQVAPPTITAVSPVTGPVSGGNTISVTGTGFMGQPRFAAGAVGPTGGSSYGLTTTGQLYAWGGNANSNLGDGTTTQRNTPVRVGTSGVMAGKTITKLAVGYSFGLALDTDSVLYAWGYNFNSQLGNASTATAQTPVLVDVTGVLAGKKIVDISAGGGYSLALDEDGVVYSWGVSTNGQLGNGGTAQQSRPVLVDRSGVLAGKKVVKIFAGYDHAFAVDEQGVLYGWGANISSSLGDGTTTRRLSPVALSTAGPLAGVKIDMIAAGRDSTVAISQDGRVFAWGRNNVGQLGDGATTTAASPVEITNSGALAGKRIVSVSLSGNSSTAHAIAHDDAGGLYGWGYNQYGGLGNGEVVSATPYATPSPVKSDTNIPMTEVFAGTGYSCGISHSSVYYCWGQNNTGQLGDNTTNNRVGIAPIVAASLASEANFSALDVGGIQAWASSVSATNLVFTAPPHEAGVIDLSLMAGESPLVTKADAYEYLAPPTVSSVVPSQGVKTGGDTVTITGTNFGSNPSVIIGGEAASSVSRLNSTTITASTPANTVGAKDVIVTNSDGQEAVLVGGFTYIEANPVLSSIVPSSGPVAGQQQVTLRGDNFIAGPGGELPVVTIGGAVATDVVLVSATELTAKTPAGTPGVYDVAIASYDGKTSVLAGAYEYLAPPVVTDIAPGEGSVRGGDVVTITGANIHEDATVKFGSVEATQVTRLSDTSLLATTPAHYAGPKNVTITNPDGQPAILPNAFTYRSEPPTITSVTPRAGTMSGGQTVTITGEGFEARRQRSVAVVNETGAPILNANILIQLDTASLVAAGKMRADGGDIRVSAASGGLLPYYLESGANTSSTIIWTTVAELPVGETALNLSYGTPEMESESDPQILFGKTSETPVMFALTDELLVEYPGINQTVCSSWSVPGGGRIVAATISHATEPTYDIFTLSAGDTQFYRSSGSVVDMRVAITNQARSLSSCLQTDGSQNGGYGGRVTSVEAHAIVDSVTATVGSETFMSRISFDGTAATIVTITDTTATIETPPHLPGLVDVVVESDYSDAVVAQDAYTFLPAGYTFTNTALSIASGESGELWVEARDMGGEPVVSTDNIVLELSTSSDAGAFADTPSAATWDKTTVTIPAGQSRAKMYYKDNLQGTPVVTATDVAGTSVAQQQNIGPRYKLLVTGVSDPARAGVPSSVTIQAVDVNGVPLSDYTGTVRFTTSDGSAKLPRDQSIAAENRGRFTFVNGVTMMTEGEQCVTVTDINYPTITGSQCDISVLPPGEGTPSKLQIVTPAQSFPLSEYSSPITVQAQDVNGDPAVTLADLPVFFHSTSSTGQFSLDGTAWFSAPLEAVIQSGTSSLNIYYRDTATGEHTLTVRDEEGTGADIGWTNAEQPIAVGVGAASKLRVSGDERITAGVWTPIRVGLSDAGDNSVSVKRDVQFTLTSDSDSARFSTAADGADATASMTGIVTTGSQYVTVYVSDTTNHQLVLQASDTSPPEQALSAGSFTTLIESAEPLRVAFMPVEDTKIYDPVQVHAYLQDEFGNTVIPKEETGVSFATSRTSGGFATTETGVWESVLSSTIEPGQSGLSAFYRDTKRGVAELSATSDGLLTGTMTANILPQAYDPGDGGKIVFSSPPSVVTTDDASAMTVTLQDKYAETAVAAAPVTIRFTLTAGQYSLDDGSTWLTTGDVEIPAGESSATVIYRNHTVGQATLRAQDAATGVVSRISHNVRIDGGVPAGIVFANDARIVAKGGVTEALVAQLRDAHGNDTTAQSSLSGVITAASPSGEFSLDGLGGWTSDLAVIFAEGATSQNIYYRDTTVGAHTVELAASGLSSASQVVRVVEGFVGRLEMSAPTSAEAGETVPVTVSSHMETGEEVAVVRDTVVQLRGQGEFSLTENPFTPVTSLTLRDGESRKELFYRSAAAGLMQLRAFSASDDWEQATAAVAVSPGAYYALAFTAAPATSPVNEASDEFVVSTTDLFGNITLVDEQAPVYLHTDSGSGAFAATPDTWGDSSLLIDAGTSSGSFYYRDTTLSRTVALVAGDTSQLDEPDTGIVNAHTALRVVGQTAEKLGFSTANQTVAVGEFSNIITIQAQKNDGSPAIQGQPLTVSISGAAGDQFFTARNDDSRVNSLTIPVGESSASFYVKPAAAGERSLEAVSGAARGSHAITVVAGEPAELEFTSGTQSIVAGEASGQITISLRDASGNLTTARGDTVVNLGSSCTAGEFSLATGSSWSSTDSLVIAAGQSTGLFYYRANVAGWCTLTVSGGGLEAAEQAIYVRGAVGVRLQLDAPATIGRGQTATVTASLRDAYGNIVTNTGSYRPIYFSSSSSEAVFSATMSYMVPGDDTVSVTYRDMALGSPTLTAKDQSNDADTGWNDAATTTEIVRGEATALGFAEPTMNAVAGEARQVRIELRNQYGAPYVAESDMTLSLSSSAQDGYFVASPEQGSDEKLTSITLRAGQSGGDVYYVQRSATSAQLRVSGGSQEIGDGVATVSVISAAVEGLRFASSPTTGEVNEPRSLTIEARDRYGNASVLTSDTTVYLHSSSSTGSFMLSASGAPVGSVVIPAGSSNMVVYYKDQTVGPATLTASDRPYASEPAGIDNATQQATTTAPTPNKAVFVDAPQTLERGQVSGKIGVELRSRFDVPVSSQGARTLYLTETSGVGAFALAPGGPWNVTQVQIPNGESRVDIHYRNTDSLGALEIVASDVSTPAEYPDTGLANARQTISMEKGEFAQLRFETAPLVQTAKHPSPQLSVKAYNQYGVETSVQGPTSVYIRSTHAGAEFSADGALWGINRLTLAPSSGASTASFYYRDSRAGTPIITVSTKQSPDPTAISVSQEQTILLQNHAGFLVTNIADPQYLGTPSSLVVAAVDDEGYVIDWYDGTITISSSDVETVLPGSYTFDPLRDNGIHTFTNGIAFTSTGEKTITVTDDSGKQGAQTNITVLGAIATKFERLAFIEPKTSYQSVANQASPVMTVQAQDAAGNAYVAGAGGLPVQLRSTNGTGQFALSPNGPWQQERMVTIPRGLSYVNVYYRDTNGQRATLSAVDWVGGVDDPAVTNATFAVLGADEQVPVEQGPGDQTSQPPTGPSTPAQDGSLGGPESGSDTGTSGSAPGDVIVPGGGRMPLVGAGTAPVSLATLLPEGLVRILQSPATQFVFPLLLFMLLLILVVVLLRQVYLELRRAREMRAILAKAAQTARDKNEFLTIAAHYLRTPISIIGSAASLLARTGSDAVLADQITRAATSLSQKSESILAETEARQELQTIDESHSRAAVSPIYRSLLFWLPVVLTVALTLLINWVINDVGGQVSAVAYLEQTLLVGVGALLLYVVLRERYVARERRDLLEATSANQAALDRVKNEFVVRTYENLSADVAQLIGLKNQLDLSQPIAKALEDGSRRLLSLVAKFQTLSQIESLQVRLSDFDTDALLHRALTPLEEAALTKQVVITSAVPPTHLQQDEGLVASVLNSVVANAIDYSPAGGEVTVTAQQVNSELVVTVTDDGPGFSRDPAELMRPFERGESAQSVEHEGVGLSLYLDKIIMDHLGGQIEAANAEGSGAQVTIRVPLSIG